MKKGKRRLMSCSIADTERVLVAAMRLQSRTWKSHGLGSSAQADRRQAPIRELAGRGPMLCTAKTSP